MSKTIYDLLVETTDLNVLIGEARSHAWKGGPTYVSFANGVMVPEGEIPPHVGVDVERASDILPTALRNAIVQEAEKRGADSVIIRAGTEDSPVVTAAAEFNLLDNKYYPARLQCRTRVAFINFTQGAYNHGN